MEGIISPGEIYDSIFNITHITTINIIDDYAIQQSCSLLACLCWEDIIRSNGHRCHHQSDTLQCPGPYLMPNRSRSELGSTSSRPKTRKNWSIII